MTLHERMDSIADLVVAGGLSVEDQAEAERHATQCPACGALLRDAREFSAWTKGVLRPDAPPSDLEDRLIERFRAEGRTQKRRFIVGYRVLKVTGSIAAAAALVVLGNLFQARQEAEGQLAASDPDRSRSREFYDTDTAVDVPTGGIDPSFPATSSATKYNEYFGRIDVEGRNGDDKPAAFGRRPNRLEERLGEGLDEASKSRAIRGDSKQQLRKEKEEGALGLSAPPGGKPSVEFRSHSGWFLAGAGGDMDKPGKLDQQGEVLRAKPVRKNDQNRDLADLPKLDPGAKDAPDPGKPEAPRQRLKHGEPTVSTLAVAVDELDLKATVAAGEEGKEQHPSTLHPGLQDIRKIIRTAEVSLEVDSYEATYTKLSELVTAEKGLVSSASTQKAANGKMQATVILRVPPDRFEAVLARLRDFGTIRSQNVDSEDVTKAYVDLETRRKSKEILAERLSKLLAEGKGTVKDLMEVEVQLGATNEAIEQIKGEIKYYDNRIALSSLTLQISEKDFGQPFEFVQTLQANLALTVRDPDEAYTKAQKEITDAGGQVVDSRMNRQSDGSSTGTIRGRVDADKFQSLRESLKKLGIATNDTVNQQKTAHGGREGLSKTDAQLRKEQAVLDLSVSSPPIFVTRRSQLVVETADVDGAYQNSRRSVEASGGKIVDGSLTGRGDRMVAVLKIQAEADRFGALMESLKAAGKVKSAAVSSVLPTAAADGGAPLLRERAEIEFTLVSPPQLIGEENGLLKTLHDTMAGSWTGLLWSVEKLFVGISLAGPWMIVLALGVFFWRRRRKKSPSAAP